MAKPVGFLQIIIILFISGIFFSCGAIKPFIDRPYENWRAASPPDSSELVHSVFLIGDVGSPSLDPLEPNLTLMKSMLEPSIFMDSLMETSDTLIVVDTLRKPADPKQTVIFLGDNIYYHGLPKPDASDREKKEASLVAQMDVVKNIAGNKFFVPGNHDWDEQGRDGWNAVRRQELFVEIYLDSQNVFVPTGGCPGPVEVQLGNDLVLIILDSQWWLHRWDKPVGPEDGCNSASKLEIIIQLNDILERNKGKNIMVVQHHPLFSNSSHGGWYNWKDYVFPLTLLRDNLYIPLPVIGAIYPLMRQYGITRQDMQNPVYAQMKEALLSVIEDEPYLVFGAGHDHNLQMKRWGEFHHIVSGSGCKDNFARKGNDVIFAYAQEGFVKVNYYKNGEVWAEAWEAIGDGDSGRIVFRTPLYSRQPKDVPDFDMDDIPDYVDSIKVIAPGPQYQASRFTRFWLGDHYRNTWATPVEVPYLDLKVEEGGLIPVKRGGGMQTISLRLRDTVDTEWNFRSINKNPASVLPEAFRNTFAKDLVQDQISAVHPYAAFTMSVMSDAIGIYHTDPRLRYMPSSPLLGHYLEEYSDMMGMLEIRPDESLIEYNRFGNTKNAVSTRTLYRHLYEDNDHYVDQHMFLRSRLFDMLINDWDRHEGQWRWAEFKLEDKGSRFEPIPRDRDNAYYKFDGVLPWLASRKWAAARKLQHFDHDYRDVKGLNINAAHLDRSLLNNLSQQEWMAIADSIQALLTDEVIEVAIRQMPAPAFEQSGQEIIDKLKSRRDKLDEAAREYYLILAKQVDVVGSDKHEYFEVERINDRETRVTVYKTKKDGEVKKVIYNRIFLTEETRELRLYGLGGQDSFVLTGVVRKGPLIRIIGGPQEDVFINNSRVRGFSNHVKIFDDASGENTLEVNTDTKVSLSSEEYMNTYIQDEFQYNYLGPRLYVEYNRDDGIFLGGGLFWSTYDFKKKPAMEHLLTANYAMNTGAYTFKYSGDFYHVFGRDWGLKLQAVSYGPKYVFNYFGQGNETPQIHNIQFYRIPMKNVELTPSITYHVTDFFQIGFGPRYEYFKVEEKVNNILHHLPETAEKLDDAYRPEHFLGAGLFANIDLVDNDFYPTRGLRFFNSAKYIRDLVENDDAFARLSTDFRFYVSPNVGFPTTFALRIGVDHNIGEFNFYQSNFLGNIENLRGYRKTRFAGRTAFYTNLDLRLGLLNFENVVLSGNSGIIGFVDMGRVWSDTGSSNVWHRSAGPGIFLNFYEYFLISAHLGFSEEGKYVNMDFGFFF